MGYEATLQIPQVFPRASLINPLSPHVVPHEFLTFHDSAVTPTKRTPWFNLVAQLLNTPDLYSDHFVASTATEMGCLDKEFAKVVQSLMSVKPEILKAPAFLVQVPFLAVYGYSS